LEYRGVEIGVEEQPEVLVSLGQGLDEPAQLKLFLSFLIGIEKLHNATDMVVVHQTYHQ
jgi:hypothetical protein